MSRFVVVGCFARDSKGSVAWTSSRFSIPLLFVLVNGAVLRRFSRSKSGVRVSVVVEPSVRGG